MISKLHLSAAALLFALFLGSGCELRDAGCVADDECRDGRFCADDGSCRDLTDIDTNAATNGGTNGANGGTNGVNGSTNNVNGDPNNVNGDPNNVNGDPNNVNGDPNNVNGDPNNGQTPFCESADDCEDPGAPVCSQGDDPDTLVCTEAEMCLFSGGFAGGGGCGFIWECSEEQAVVECRQRDDGTRRCTCVREDPNGGEVQEFETDDDLCTASDAEVADTVNILCGWRIPVEPR